MLKDGDPDHLPGYIYNTFALTLASNEVDTDDFTPNRIHTYTCNGGKSLQIEQGTILSDLVIVTTTRSSSDRTWCSKTSWPQRRRRMQNR